MAAVDSQLPKGPSGEASKLAAKHTAEHPLKLYGAWFCPFVQRAWITLQEKAMDYQYIEINPYDKSPSFLAMNPRGLVPTLVVDGAKPLFESTIICEYLDDVRPDGPKLLPTEPYQRARARLWIDHIGSRIVPAFYRMMQHQPDKDYSLDEVRAELRRQVEALVEQMDPRGPWFLGDKISLVDISLIPWLRRLWLVDEYKPGGSGLPKGGEGDVWVRWAAWVEAVNAQQSARETSSDDESYLAAYKRYAEDTTGSKVGQATRGGQKLP
ncbi:hypothetical protein CDD80_3771 [Ophiocordyceps camponoti-rufipedis]|uniref:GST N-terminal domain-containing protein n=1 Tax=Ophiocordyceps camponoti-rufipedis TaxID=2004952 RepID=A0A2C5YNW6_9HYPO|nr:hypothetical protein CDD80_3771 [Ophiocordyceps camponoti-rufipedis]